MHALQETLPVAGLDSVSLRLPHLRDVGMLNQVAVQYPQLRTECSWAADPQQVYRYAAQSMAGIIYGDRIEYRIAMDGESTGADIIGSVSLSRIGAEEGHWDLDCWVAPPYRRLGFARESAQSVIEYAGRSHELSKVTMTLAEANVAGRRLAEALGARATPIRLETSPRNDGQPEVYQQWEITR